MSYRPLTKGERILLIVSLIVLAGTIGYASCLMGKL